MSVSGAITFITTLSWLPYIRLELLIVMGLITVTAVIAVAVVAVA